MGQQVGEQHDGEALLVARKDTGKEETIMCFFDELPLFVEQEGSIDAQSISIQALQKQDINNEVTLDKVSTQDMEDEEVLGEECFDSIIKDLCENLGVEILGCEPINEIPISKIILLENFLLEFKFEAIVKNILQVDSLDKLLNILTEDDMPLTQEEEMTWQEIIQGSHDELQQGANRMSAKFFISRSCPIRHLERIEAKNEGLIEQDIEHDPPLKDEAKDAFATKLD